MYNNKRYMFKQYKFPMQIFIILQNCNPVIFTSKSLTTNHYVISIDENYFLPLSKILKREVSGSMTFLVEQSCMDTSGYQHDGNSMYSSFFLKQKLYYNIFYSYTTKNRISVFVNTDETIAVKSLQSVFENSNWLERETAEMVKLLFKNKPDVRNLMLDYPKIEFPMLKDFPVEGYQDVYYNVFEDQVQYISSEYIEL